MSAKDPEPKEREDWVEKGFLFITSLIFFFFLPFSLFYLCFLCEKLFILGRFHLHQVYPHHVDDEGYEIFSCI